jgi:diguanylate cyclase (GGDEF)-like protein/PAS domain S-box-containing protein
MTGQVRLGLLLWHRFVLLLLLLWSTAALAQPTPTSLRIGVYDNPPKIFFDASGGPAGILIDLLREVAGAERWQLEFVACDWNRCLEMLESGQLDLMPDVAVSSERIARFDFHDTPALLSWSQLYSRRGADLVSLLDMDDRRVALLNGSIQLEYLQALVDSFALSVDWQVYDDLDDAFSAVADGSADAVAANHYYGDMSAYRLGLESTPIMFQPTQLFYAATKGRQADVLAILDRYLGEWRSDERSFYYQTLRRWSFSQTSYVIPAWAGWAVATLLILLAAITVFSITLRYQVSARTQSLQASEDRLNTILNSVEAYIFIKDHRLRYQYVNWKVCALFGLAPEQIIGKTDKQFFDEKTCERLHENDLKVIRNGERVADEERYLVPGDPEEHSFLSVKLPLRNPDGTVYALCGISTDITEHRQIRDQLHQLAFFDPLTGLPNRRLILDRLDHALASSAKTGFQGALLLVDLDNFKNVNDTLGHHMGDLLLQLVAKRLETALLSTDTAGRLAADEFVMIVEDLAQSTVDALQRVHELTEALRSQLKEPFDLQGTEYNCSVSIGAALFADVNGNADELLKAVDLALSAAKESGRDIVRFFNPAMQTEVTRRTRLEKALRKALEHNSLELFWQPQVDASGRVIAMEGLLRWRDQVLGEIPPSDFIPVAESCGLIIPIGEWVIEQACQQLDAWRHDPLLCHLTLSVNLSSRQFHHEKFVEHIQQMLAKYQVRADQLELEVTESLLIDNLTDTVQRMKQLCDSGIRFALDDFGTGYASLSYLKQLPLSQLKIDQSFVRDLLVDSNDEAIVRTIIALGGILDLRVIAEGVELPEHAAKLSQMGCNYFQGYLFGKPLPAAEWALRIRAANGRLLPLLPAATAPD